LVVRGLSCAAIQAHCAPRAFRLGLSGGDPSRAEKTVGNLTPRQLRAAYRLKLSVFRSAGLAPIPSSTGRERVPPGFPTFLPRHAARAVALRVVQAG